MGTLGRPGWSTSRICDGESVAERIHGQYRRLFYQFSRRSRDAAASPETSATRKLGRIARRRDVCLRDPGTYELATGKETVRHELARAEGARGVRHGGYASNKEACFVPYVPYKRVAGAAQSPALFSERFSRSFSLFCQTATLQDCMPYVSNIGIFGGLFSSHALNEFHKDSHAGLL